MEQCEHRFQYVGVRYKDGVRSLPGTGAVRRYYAHVYFCERCCETRGESIADPDPHRACWTSYSKIQFDATPGTAEQCGVSSEDR